MAKRVKTAKKPVKPVPGKKGGVLDQFAFDVPLFVCPDAYADVPGTQVDTSKTPFSARVLGYSVKASLFGATYKVVGSINGVDFFDLTGQDLVGVNRAIDIAVPVNTAVITTFGSGATPAGWAAQGMRYYKMQAKNTVALSVANIVASIVGKQ